MKSKNSITIMTVVWLSQLRPPSPPPHVSVVFLAGAFTIYFTQEFAQQWNNIGVNKPSSVSSPHRRLYGIYNSHLCTRGIVLFCFFCLYIFVSRLEKQANYTYPKELRKTLQLLPKRPQPFVKWCIETSTLLSISQQ